MLLAATKVTRSSVSVYAKLLARGFTSGVVEGFTAAVGNTPLVEHMLHHLARARDSVYYRYISNPSQIKPAALFLARQNSRIQVVV